MRPFFTFQYLLFLAVLLFFSCNDRPACRELKGAWSDREGHDFVFLDNGQALWLNRFGQVVDTVRFVFSINCRSNPVAVDFSRFDGGPFEGKSLYGIIEWSADSLFRLCYEIGQQPDCRPKDFDPPLTMKFYR